MGFVFKLEAVSELVMLSEVSEEGAMTVETGSSRSLDSNSDK